MPATLPPVIYSGESIRNIPTLKLKYLSRAEIGSGSELGKEIKSVIDQVKQISIIPHQWNNYLLFRGNLSLTSWCCAWFLIIWTSQNANKDSFWMVSLGLVRNNCTCKISIILQDNRAGREAGCNAGEEEGASGLCC